MRSLDYRDVARTIAACSTAEERLVAREKLGMYYATRPIRESVAQRMRILRQELSSSCGTCDHVMSTTRAATGS